MSRRSSSPVTELSALSANHDIWERLATKPADSTEVCRDRILRGWRHHAIGFRKGLDAATPRGRALWHAADACVKGGLHSEKRPIEEQAALYAASTQTSGEGFPTQADFGQWWIAAGGIASAIDEALRGHRVVPGGAHRGELAGTPRDT